MFNLGNCGCTDGCGNGGELWSWLLNLIIVIVVLEFLCGIINGGCGNNIGCGCGC